MKCSLKTCHNEIPKARKKSAKYCSGDCYYEAKKDRSLQRYASINGATVEVKNNESILAFLYSVSMLNKPINADDLNTYNFNFNLSTGEHFDDRKGPCKIIGNYAYHISSDKTLTIWKLKESR
jgi:hypothetical protein